MESPNSPRNAVANRELTPEFVLKWDLDLGTIRALDQLAESRHCVFILRGGIAAEAYAGGYLTRAHNDIDAQFVNTGNMTEEEILGNVTTLLKSEKTSWQLYQRSPDKIEFREKEDNRPFFDRRRLELKILKEPRGLYSKSNLFFTNGRSITVNVTEFYQFVAEKVRKLFMVNDRPEEAERETNLSDYADLKRLVDVPNYRKDLAIDNLSKILKKALDKSAEAKREYDFVINLLEQL